MKEAVFIFTPSHMQQQYLEPVFDSIAKHISIPYKFCLFTDKVNEDFSSKYDIVIKTINDEDLSKLNELFFREGRGDIPAFSAYAQFVLPRYFSEFKHFVYLEVDQTVRVDLADLWEECLRNKAPLAAAPYIDNFLNPTTIESFDNIHPNATCFNTGVLFVDSEFWNSNNLESMCFNELKIQKEMEGKRLDFYAQGAINNALHEYIYELSWLYNVQGVGSIQGISRKVLESAKILHWTGRRKPWKDDGLYKDLYYDDPKLKNEDDYKFNALIHMFKKLKYYLSKMK